MSPETRRPQDVLSQYVKDAIDPDLAPITELEVADYFRIINSLTNLVIGTVQFLRDSGLRHGASELACRASGILTDYDPGVAELVLCPGIPPGSEELPNDAAPPDLESPPRR